MAEAMSMFTNLMKIGVFDIKAALKGTGTANYRF